MSHRLIELKRTPAGPFWTYPTEIAITKISRKKGLSYSIKKQ